jgi:hypothetical protein
VQRRLNWLIIEADTRLVLVFPGTSNGGPASEPKGITRMDIAIMLTLVGSFAILCTVHLAIAIGLALHKPRWKGLLALLVFPLAPYWGHEIRMRLRVTLWVGAFFLYVLALVAALVQA